MDPFRIDAHCLGINISEDRLRPHVPDGSRRGDEGEDRRHDFVAGSDAQAPKRVDERRGSGRDAHTERGAAEPGEARFKLENGRTADIASGGENGVDGFFDLPLNPSVLGLTVTQRNGYRRAHG